MAALVRHDAPSAATRFADLIKPGGGLSEIERLYVARGQVDERRNPRTARLLAAGRRKMAQKLMEEAGDLALEATRQRTRAGIRESADLG